MIVQIYAQTDVGLARSQNEDSVAFDVATGLCILADGMGGHNAGEVASGMATTFIRSEMRDAIADAGKHLTLQALQVVMEQTIEKANATIFNMSRANPQYTGMGTTLVIAAFHGNTMLLGHIGDSRCYRMRDYQLQQLTKDHSFRQEQIDSGLLQNGSTSGYMGNNLVTRALGVNESVQADINQYETMVNDIYLMCSDGLTDMVTEDAICAILQGADSIEQKTRQLICAANNGGGRDNISVLLAQPVESPAGGLFGTARRVIQGILPARKRR